jgi:hypothetical protein
VKSTEKFDGRVISEILLEHSGSGSLGLMETTFANQPDSGNANYNLKLFMEGVPGSAKYIIKSQTTRGKE